MRSNDYASQTDRELVIGTANGDNRAFAALYERYFEDIYDFTYRLLPEADAAAAVTENTFAEAHRSLPGRHVPDSIRAWLYSLALAGVTSAARQLAAGAPSADAGQRDLTSLTAINKSRLPGREDVAQDIPLREAVWESAAQVGTRELAMLDMDLRRGLASGEIAEGLSMSPQTADVTLSNVRQSFEKTFAARLLLLRGREACPELAALLQRASAPEHSTAVQEAVHAHVAACETCASTLRANPPPADVFAAFAPVPAPAGLKEIVWGNLAAAAPATVVVATEEHKRRPWVRVLLILLGLLAVIGIAALLFFLFSGGGSNDLKDPSDVRSTSHKIGEPSTNRVVKIVWSRQDNVRAFSIEWSKEQFKLPDEVGDLSGDATDATSPELGPGDWFFHLRTQGDDGKWTSTVHIGPFVIVLPSPSPTLEPTEVPQPTEEPTPEPTAEPASETPTRAPAASPTGTP